MTPDFKAKKFDYTDDTVFFDLVLVMDKFTAADVMREVRLSISELCEAENRGSLPLPGSLSLKKPSPACACECLPHCTTDPKPVVTSRVLLP